MSAKYFQSSARSALGLIRQGNEDSAFISAQLIAVADGMGGHAAGEVASKIAVKVLHSLVPTLTAQEIDQDSVEDLLMHSLHSIDYEIAAITEEDTDKRGMGTTLTALLIRDEQIALFRLCVVTAQPRPYCKSMKLKKVIAIFSVQMVYREY